MAQLTRKIRQPFKHFAEHFGLYPLAVHIKGLLDPKRIKYRNIKVYEVILNDIPVRFSTEDDFSNIWFFTRLAREKRIYEPKVTRYLLQALDGATCFVDIGANVGWFTCLAGKHMPQGRIYSFEMDELNYSILKKNILFNNCNNIEAHNLAVSNASGTLRYQRDFSRPSLGFRLDLAAKENNTSNLVSVNTVALDSYFEDKEIKPDVIKIDVEGAEMSVLHGMRHLLRNYKPVLFLEIHPSKLPFFNTSASDVLDLLTEEGYILFEIEDMRLQEANAPLRKLHRNLSLEENTMIYGISAGQSMIELNQLTNYSAILDNSVYRVEEIGVQG